MTKEYLNNVAVRMQPTTHKPNTTPALSLFLGERDL